MQDHAIGIRRFGTQDQRLEMTRHGGISTPGMADGSAGRRAIFGPGRTWMADEKPLPGAPAACPVRHSGECLSGRLVVRMPDRGRETRIGTGDIFDTTGRDARVAPGGPRRSASRRPGTRIDHRPATGRHDHRTPQRRTTWTR